MSTRSVSSFKLANLTLFGSFKFRSREKSFYKFGNSVKIHNKNKRAKFFFEKLSQKNKMTNSKEIDEIVGEMDQYESLSNSEASFDLAPTIQKEIKQLADSLR